MKKYYRHLVWLGKYSIVECKDHSYAYSGKMPCTGSLRCIFCGKIKNKLH